MMPGWQHEAEALARRHVERDERIARRSLCVKGQQRAITRKLAFPTAMQIALGKVNGRVMEAERDNNRDQVVYKVKVLATDNVLHKVVIDANSGNVLSSNVDYDD